MLGLGVYIALVLIVGAQYAIKPYYEGYQVLRESLGSMSDMDQKFLDELIRELAEERQKTGSAGAGSSGGSPGGGQGVAGLPPDSAVGLGTDPYLTGNDATNSPPDGNSGLDGSRLDLLNDSELKSLSRDVSLEDQMRALEIARTSLSDADIEQLVSWARGGITDSEKVEIKKLLKARLTDEQIVQLIELYNKYRN